MKKILSALLVILILIPVGFAYAETTTLTKEQIQQFKTELKAKKEALQQNRTASEALRKSVKDKSTNLKAKIREMRKNKQTFPLEKLDQIDTLLKTVKQDSADLKTLDSVFVNFERFRTYKQNKDLNGALSSIDKIIAIQVERKNGLTKLNSDLDALLALING